MNTNANQWLGIALLCGALGACGMGKKDVTEPVFVSLRESGQVARFPDGKIWPGGPKMLYTAITPDGKHLAVTSPKEGGVYFFDSGSGKQTAMVKTGKGAKGVKIHPNGKLVYVSNEAADNISVVDMESQQVVATIDTDDMPHNVRFTRDGKTAYVTLQGGAGIGVIDTTQHKVVKVIPTPGLIGPHNLDLSKDETLAYVRDTSHQVGVLELASGKMLKVIEVGQGHAGVDVSPDGRHVFTGAIADDIVTVIDTETLTVVKKIKVGFSPHGVRCSRDGRRLYVSVTSDEKLVEIDTATLSVTKSTNLAGFPFWLAVRGNP